MVSILEKVKLVLAYNEEARDCDRALYKSYAISYHPSSVKLINGEFYINLDSENIPEQQTLSRHRRNLQEKGFFVGTIREEKKKKQKKVIEDLKRA